MHKIYTVAGNPILHSRSPEMFNAAFEALSINAVYTRLAASGAKEIIDIAKSLGIHGMNITSPFKEKIIRYLDEVDENAIKINAVNTVLNKKGRFIGYNTDISGVLNAFQNSGVPIKGRKAVVLGGGGAGKAAAFALLSAGADVVVTNRTHEKARKIANSLGCKAIPINEIDKATKEAGILISCISSAEKIIEPSSLRKELVVLDANYTIPTALLLDAKVAGCQIIDGREWLLFQALPAFTYFTNKRAPIDIMRQALYRKKKAHKTNIALIGFMGTGKTTVAEGLAVQKHMPVLDIDKTIEKKTGVSIEEIFKKSGEKVFRMMEGNEISNIRNVSKTVISCGGGAVLRKKNVDTIKRHCIAVWLWANVRTILNRIHNNSQRPLLNTRNKKMRAESILTSRLPLYAHTSDLIINTEGKIPEEIVSRIDNEINNTLKD